MYVDHYVYVYIYIYTHYYYTIKISDQHLFP